MAKYHITAKGEPGICRASNKPCPLGGAHFSSKKEAAAYYEKDRAAWDRSSKPIMVIDEEAIEMLGSQPYYLSHRAPVKDADDFNKPLHDLTEIFPPDVYDHPKWYGQQYAETLVQIKAARGNPERLITIYRAVPKNVNEINPGDWVSLSHEYARDHSYNTGPNGEEGQVLKYQIPAKLLYTDANSLEEWGFSGDTPLRGTVI
jgi:hypothetical protein